MKGKSLFRSSVLSWLMVCLCIPILGQEAAKKKEREPLSEWSQQWLEEVVPYIITDAEKEVFLELPNESERGRFIQTFWERRDPDPSTSENEFKITYYKRIALANKFFGIGEKDGWRTDRGKILILLGPPQEIQRDYSPSGSSTSGIHGTQEIWNYWGLENPRLPYNLEFVFVEKFGSGNYVLQESLNIGQFGRTAYDIDSIHYHFDRLEYLAEAMKNPFENQQRLRGIVSTEVSYDLIPFRSDAFLLKGTPDNTYVPIISELLYANLPFKEIEGKYYYSLNFMVNVTDEQGEIILQRGKDLNFHFAPADLPPPEARKFRFQSGLFLAPGEYRLDLLILDNFSGKIGTSRQSLKVEDFSQPKLSMSDVFLSRSRFSPNTEPQERQAADPPRIQPFVDASQAFLSGEEMHIYFETYNLVLDQTSGLNRFQVDYEILQNGKSMARVSQADIAPTKQTSCQIQTSLRLRNFKAGEYVLQISVMDENSGQQTKGRTLFRVDRQSSGWQ
jgi:GWxTD domain-containing protein